MNNKYRIAIKCITKEVRSLLPPNGKNIWDEVFKNGPSKICGRQPLKNLKEYGLPKADHTPSYFLKVVFHKFYLVHS